MKVEFSRKELDAIENDPYLTRRERRVFNLYYRQGLNIESVAAELDPPVSRRTVTTILQKIRRKVLN